jgi:hypothetical protein
LTNVVAVAAGDAHSLSLVKQDGKPDLHWHNQSTGQPAVDNRNNRQLHE